MKNPFDDSTDLSDFIVAPSAQSSGNVIGGGSPPAPVLGAPIDIPEEEREAEAAVAASGSGGPGSVVTVTGATSAGLTINLVFDAAAMAAPQSFRDGITAAMQMICAVVTDKITLNLSIDYSGTGQGAFGGPSGGNYVNYSTVRADLVNNASPGDTTFNSLPMGSTIAGQSSVAVWYSQEKLWGMLSPTGTEIDGSASFATDISPSLLVGVALHELTHAMGRVPYGSGGQPDVFDFYRFTSPGNYLFNGNSTAPAAYFSLNGGTTKIADYGQTSDPSDFLNSGVQGSTDPFNEFYSNSTQQQLTADDLKQLDALGFHLTTNQQTQTVIEAFGSTTLVEVGSNFFLNPASGGTGPELKYGGAAFVAGTTWGAWAPIGAEAISGGYEVAFKTGADTYTVWDTDASGNLTTNALGTTSGSSIALESLEVSFQQDLNGDHIIGVPATVIELAGSTSLIKSGGDYFLGTSGPTLKYAGAVVTDSTFPGLTPIGTEATATGFEVVLHDTAAAQYDIWLTDTNGNINAIVANNLPGNSLQLESLETTFQQDLNGDHIIGVPPTVIELAGSTSLIKSGGDYFLGTSGPTLKYAGAVVTDGTFPGLTPIGTEATATGFEVVLHDTAAAQYDIWLTDTNGNINAIVANNLPGNSLQLESLETTFQQDLNGDHTIGVPATVIESAGSTSLIESGGDYFLGTSGPTLKYAGAVVTDSTFPGLTPIGTEATATGFEVVLHDTAAAQYDIWLTDTNGNINAIVANNLPGNSLQLESLETTFQQDLNGDHTIGIPSHTSPSAQVASTAPAAPAALGGGDTFIFRPDLGSTGANNSPPAALEQIGQQLVSGIEHLGTEIQHILAGDLSDLTGAHDATAHGPLFDLLHGFIIH